MQFLCTCSSANIDVAPENATVSVPCIVSSLSASLESAPFIRSWMQKFNEKMKLPSLLGGFVGRWT
ncbi:hypothetical protein WN55_06031 [Dufourea novaeangliae]|uniref:Uncharacterized protein n=1 Tax=Dufourea novaeangliae TaxID=178035 RepID=A0A154PPF2_DUFNO|nr:hypothetical protein WN55_06031 [Dufourea novaeangliae]